MQTRPPSVTRILIAIGFALSCFGLALFLWIAFGGPSPLKPESYRITVPFAEATQLATESDVRISGVTVGKVKTIELGDEGVAEAEVELDAAYAPIPENARATLREKTLLGETYVELTPGSEDVPKLPEGGTLAQAQVAESTQLDEILRTFDPETRANFQAWMQGQAASFRGVGDDLSLAIASLDPFAEEANRALRVLDSQRLAVQRFIRDGGEVFEALSERQGQLRGLISASNEVFATTAARNQELIETFQIFPTFLRESRATLLRLDEFAQETDPLVQQLRPAARELSPTLIDLGRLAPDLEAFFIGLGGTTGTGGTIGASVDGLPATQRLLTNDLRPLLTRLDPYLAQLNSILEVVGLYRSEITALLGNLTAATLNGVNEGGVFQRVLRTSAPLGPEALASYPDRLRTNRTNPYLAPRGYDALAGGGVPPGGTLPGFETRQCDGGAGDPDGIHAVLDPSDAAQFPGANPPFYGDFFSRIRQQAFSGFLDTDDPAFPKPPCDLQPDFESIGISPEMSAYLHVRQKP